MKDIYELLNDVDIDESEMDTMEVSEFEKEKVKKHLRKALKKNKGWKKKGLVGAALCCLVIGSIGAVGITNPAYAAEIPVVGDIFRFLDNGRTGVYEKYKENANEINVTRESNGVAITIKDAIYDGKTLSYTYEMKGDRDLGKSAFIYEYEGGQVGSSHIEKIGKNTYIGQYNISNIEQGKDEISCKLNIRTIDVQGGKSGDFDLDGKWDFNIHLKAIESDKEIINKGIEKEGISVNIDSVSKTKMSFIINYSDRVPKELIDKWLFTPLNIEAKDDLGNIYTGVSNGGHGDGENMTYSTTFGKLDENATKLIITPKMNLANIEAKKMDGDGNIVDVIIDEDHPAKGEIIFDDIVVDLEK
jgi:hypothetical protein